MFPWRQHANPSRGASMGNHQGSVIQPWGAGHNCTECCPARHTGIASGQTALIKACQGNHEQAVDVLLETVGSSSIDAQDGGGMTALGHASQLGHLNIAKKLVAHGSSVDTVDREGRTPLTLAMIGAKLGHGRGAVLDFFQDLHTGRMLRALYSSDEVTMGHLTTGHSFRW